MVIREINEADINDYYDLVDALDKETEYRAYEPNERERDFEKFKAETLDKINRSGIIVLCIIDGKPIGYIEGDFGKYNRNKHLIHFNIAVKLNYTGLKIGEKLINEFERLSKAKNVSRIELTVFTYNKNAIKLYKKLGYLIEGIKYQSFKAGGKKVDEFLMSKIV